MRTVEVAGYLKVTERTIYRLAGAKKIPAFKVGASWRIARKDIDEWIRAQTLLGKEESLQTGSKKTALQGNSQ